MSRVLTYRRVLASGRAGDEGWTRAALNALYREEPALEIMAIAAENADKLGQDALCDELRLDLDFPAQGDLTDIEGVPVVVSITRRTYDENIDQTELALRAPSKSSSC